MKHSIKWHEECLANHEKFLQVKREALVRLKEELERHEDEAHFYQFQIRTAKERKKDNFDRERFLVSRKTQA